VLGGNYEEVKLLLNKGADVNAKNVLGDTPLMDAQRKGLADIVNLLKEVKR
jgi:ankyrin repeat protein